jgi:DNA-binding response OmpR family regulator
LLTRVSSKLRFSAVLQQGEAETRSIAMRRGIQRILLVEPEGVLAEVTAFRLELLGYQVETVSTEEEALRCAALTKPDLVITDMILGKAPATAMIEALMSQEATNTIPVMVLSTDADLDRVTMAHKAGASDFLVVPYHPEVLQEKVANLMSRPRSVDEKDKDKEKLKATAG